ncbi:unnamed protein product [Colias eurytheme]|nr:unnamed protein product [Colias eurytheme]
MTTSEIFAEEDRKRAVQKENICHCRYKMVYIPPVKEVKPTDNLEEEEHFVDIVTEPPTFTRVCPCTYKTKPVLLEHTEPYCLQFRNLPLRTVHSRTILIRNVSSISAKISTAVRRWPRAHKRTLNPDKWADDVKEPGVVIECASKDLLQPCGQEEVTVSVYADCWGLYHDQILIQIENIEPLILDVWIEAVGPPLQFALHSPGHENEAPIIWMSSSDRNRTVRVSNPSRARLAVHPYVITENQYPQQELPFRLYIRFYDVPPRTCPCLYQVDSESCVEENSEKGSSSFYQEMDTAIELYLSRDFGVQDDTYYKLEPSELSMDVNSQATPSVTLSQEPVAPPSVVLFRTRPIDKYGPGWYRPEPSAQLVRLLAVTRLASLLVLPSKLCINVCALDLPMNEVLRVRKRLHILNTGSGPLKAFATTDHPWRLLIAQNQCDAKCLESGARMNVLELNLPPRSSTEISAEVTIKTMETWPPPTETYEPHKHTTTELKFFDDQDIFLLSIPLQLDLEFLILKTEPSSIDFGYVMDGDARKTYFTVMHSSHTVTIPVTIECIGDPEFRVWPPSLILAPNSRERVYVQYVASWRSSPAECRVRISAQGRGVLVCVRSVCASSPHTRPQCACACA